jgi:hypothetical protein
VSFGNPTPEDPRGDGTSRPLHPWFQDPVVTQWWTLAAMYAESDAGQYPARAPYMFGSIKELR